MTDEAIKEKLKALYECKADFMVIQTGKKSASVNGLYLYKSEPHEIILHNNFATENELMYTAIHEFAHHVMMAENGAKSSRSHSGLFWKTYYDLLDKAIEEGVYSRTRCTETADLIETAKNLQKAIADAQARLGDIIAKLNESCRKNNERIEDVIEHDLQMTRSKAKDLLKLKNSAGVRSDEIVKAISSARNKEAKKAAITAAEEGKTVAQVKAIARDRMSEPSDNFESPDRLMKEKKRLVKTIECLQERLEIVEEKLNPSYGQ